MGLNVDQELFGVFAFYNAVVILKMLLMAFLTARWISNDEEGEEINQKWTKSHLLSERTVDTRPANMSRLLIPI